MKKGQSCTIIMTAILLSVLATSVLSIPASVEAQSDEDLFTITLIAPGDANLLRRQWGLIIANSFQSVGIDARVVFLGWGGVFDRVFDPPTDMIGKTYAEGGFDIQLVGWSPGNPALPYSGTFQNYHSQNMPPGNNYFLWDNATADAYIDEFMSKGYNAEGIQAFKNWQQIQFDDLPASQIHYSKTVTSAVNDLDFHGWDWIFDNIGTEVEYLTGRTSVVLASTGELLDLNPPLSQSWYDTIVYTPVFDGLFNINTTYQYPMSKSLLTGYTSTDNGTWVEHTYMLRNNVTFHDGIELDADDVLFTKLANLLPETGTWFSNFISGFMGDDISFKWLNGTTTRLVLDFTAETPTYSYPANASAVSGAGKKVTVEAVDKYTVKVSGANITATYHPAADSVLILPKHVLELIPWASWDTHTFNTGVGSYESNGQTFYGPIGTGPYVYKGFDAVKALNTLEKYSGYWDKANLEGAGLYEVQDFYVRYIVEKDSAIAALKNDEVQVLGGQYQLQRDYLAGNLDFATNYELAASGIQQVGYNMEHPVIGTGVETPLGIQDPSRAAEAARYVRQALDYLIPRDLIVQNLMGGFGDAAAVHVNPLSPYTDTSIIAREYDPVKAKLLLALAGYEVGVIPGGPTTLSNYMLGQPAVFTGTFSFDTVAGQEQEGIIVLLESSTDNATWTPVAQGVTTTGGYYSLSYTPQQSGNYYFRTILTGIGAVTAAASSNTGPDFMYSGLPGSVSPQNSTSVQVIIKSFDSVLSEALAPLSLEVSDLTSQLSTLTTVAYAGIIIAVIAIVIAFLVRKS